MNHFEKAWRGFQGRVWRDDVNVRDFIQQNYTPYEGDEGFLAPPTEATNRLWGRLQELQKEERARGGVLECETEVVSGLTAYGPGYIDESLKDLEKLSEKMANIIMEKLKMEKGKERGICLIKMEKLCIVENCTMINQKVIFILSI